MITNNEKLESNVKKMHKNKPKNNPPFEIDETDRQILKILMQDCRLSYREIARRLKISFGTVVNRMRKLTENGIIKGYSAIVDSRKVGYNVVVVIEVTMKRGMIRQVEDEIAHFPNVCGVYDVTGRPDAIVIAKFKDTNELSNFVKDLQAVDYIDRTETLVVLDTEKEDFRLI